MLPPLAPPAPVRPLTRLSGPTAWLHAWTLAARMSWRDILRHRGRSVVIVTMIALPVLVLTLAASYYQTYASPEATVFQRLGHATGSLHARQVQQAVAQATAGKHTPSPVFPQANDVANEASALRAIEKYTGTKATPEYTTAFRFTSPDSRQLIGSARSFNLTNPATAPLFHLREGRLPSGPQEALVSRSGVENLGLPRRGTVNLGMLTGNRPTPQTLTVVGVADIASVSVDRGAQADLLLPTTSSEACLASNPRLPHQPLSSPIYSPCPVLLGGAPISEDAQRTLQAAGLDVSTPEQITPYLNPLGLYAGDTSMQIVTLIAVALLIEMTALVGPAFAISAAQRRRSVVLGLMNGATPAHGRRLLLAQALLLGLLGALIAVVLGVALFAAGTSVLRDIRPDFSVRSIDVPLTWLVALFGFAAAASVIAALLPARGLARLDVAALTQRPGSDGPAPRWMLVVGALMVAGSLAITYLTHASAPVISLFAAIVMVVGGILITPTALCLVAWLGRRAPVPWRLAARDALRHRRRTVPAVGAILGVTSVLTAAGLIAGANFVQSELNRVPEAPIGWAYSSSPVATESLGRLTGNRVVTLQGVLPPRDEQDKETVNAPDVALIKPGCSPDARQQIAPACLSVTHFSSSPRVRQGIVFAPLPDLVSLGKLNGADERVLRDGGVLTTEDYAIRDGKITLGISTPYLAAPDDPGTSRAQPPLTLARSVPLPASTFSGPREGAMWTDRARATIMTLDTAVKIGLPQHPHQVLSPVTDDAGLAAVHTQRDRGAQHSIRYASPPQAPAQVALTSLLIPVVALIITLICTMTTTALTLHEQRHDLATASAIGATARTRRRYAAAHAYLVALLGCLAGVSIGILVGLPQVLLNYRFTRSFDTFGYDASPSDLYFRPFYDGTLATLPWGGVVALLVVVPLIAAGFATFLARREPGLGRRRG